MTAVRTPPSTVFILAFDDCDQLDVTGPFEVLTTAVTTFGTKLDVRVKSVPGTTADPGGMVRAASGLEFRSEPWNTGDLPDVLIVAGGIFEKPGPADPTKTIPAGIGKQRDNPDFTGRIERQHRAGRTVASVCTGAFGVVGAGIAGHRHMTTHPGTLGMLAAYAAQGCHPAPVLLNPDWEARVVDAGDIISCGGVTSGIDEALYLLNAFWSQSLEEQVRGFIDFHYRANLRTFPR